ncbi:MAG: hypothetical protein B7Y45_06650 [Sphingomonas sp. 28-66-16]|nr:MAG: hypothetical protein B7Y45_06650 [Sphingomonas sp. 28-66-16]
MTQRHLPTRPGMQPEDWRDWAASAETIGGPARFDRAFLQCWAGTSAKMRQPALDHHLIVLHRGGPKRVKRIAGSRCHIVDVPLNAFTTIESGSIYRWDTEGPIAFAHLFVAPERFADVVSQAFDRDPASVGLAETVGQSDRHVAALFDLLIASRYDPDWAAVADDYLDALLLRLAATSASGGVFRTSGRITLTPRTIARVREFIDAHLQERISLDDLARVAGYSRYHFVRAFRQASGVPPYTYLLQMRIRAAAAMLRESDRPIAQIARDTGFATHAQFSTRFRETIGVTPAIFRGRADAGNAATASPFDTPAVRSPERAGRYNAG